MSIDYTNNLKPWCRAAVVGHSFVALSTERIASGAGFNTTLSPRGGFFWPQLIVGPKFDCPHMTAGRHGGQNTTTMALDANINAFIAECAVKKINTVLFLGLCNDPLSSLAASTATIANVTKMVRAWTGAGMRVIVTGDFPTTGAALRSNPGNLQGFSRLRHFMMNDLPDMFPGVGVVDVFAQACPYNSTTGEPLPGLVDSDGLHPTVKGHYLIWSAVARLIDAWFPSNRNLSVFNNSELYSSTLNKRGNILTNGMLTGNTSGIATSWTNGTTPAGMTVTASKVLGDNWEQQQFVYGGTPSGAAATHQFRQDFSTASINAGDTVRASGIIELEGGRKNFRGIEMQLSISDSSGGYTGQCGYSPTLGDVWPDNDFTGENSLFFMTPESVVTGPWTTGQFCRFFINTVFDAAGVAAKGTLRLSNLKVFKTGASANY